MIRHYLELAWQQLTKYRLQSVVSIVSLAIGFACFALASMWIKYETTYDAFHRDAENIYVLTQGNDYILRRGMGMINYHAFREIPELEQLTSIRNILIDSANGVDLHRNLYDYLWQMNDTNFVNLFGLDILEGSTSFVHNENEIAISDRLAKFLWKDESPIGKPLSIKMEIKTDNLKYERTLTVAAVFRSWGEHSNFMFDMLTLKLQDFLSNYFREEYMMAHVSPKVDIEKLNARLDTLRIYSNSWFDSMSKEEFLTMVSPEDKFKLIPLTELYYSNEVYNYHSKFKFNHIYLFSVACSLLIACALLNYLTMFINRLFIRKREMALRTVFGATSKDLMLQFFIEYGLLLLIALLLGLFITFGLMNDFLTLADLQIGRTGHFLYRYMEILPEMRNFFIQEILRYILLVFLVSLLVSVPFIWYFRRQSLQSNIAGVGGLAKYNLFRYISTGLQMGISIFCIFCTVVLLKQLDTLRYGDIGFERENRMYHRIGYIYKDMHEGIFSFIKSCPEVDTIIKPDNPIYPAYSSKQGLILKESNPDISENFRTYYLHITKETADFYGLKLLEGRFPFDGEENAIVVNEAFVHKTGWEETLGRQLSENYLKEAATIVGVVKDFHNESPLIKSKPYILHYSASPTPDGEILLRYKPGMKQALLEKVEAYYNEHEIPFEISNWEDMTEKYNKMLVSEDNLRLLLFITTGVCILIALFGVWSMIMLTCEQRRKEIAVRKVFGATTKDILDMFIVEYMALQGVAALVAFPIGYACMKPWLEQYVVQTSIPWWIYVGIFLMVALLVALCVGWRVWKTATAHPADEICKG